MYLTPKDYKLVTSPEDRAILSYEDDPEVLNQAEWASVTLVKSMVRAYARGRYNLDAIFIPVSAYDAAQAYHAGDHVYKDETIYVALQASTGVPLADPTYWQPGDQRPALVPMYIADIAVYHLYSHIMPDNIPELREKRYKAALDFFRDVRDGVVDPDWPIIEGSNTPRYGTNPRKTWYL